MSDQVAIGLQKQIDDILQRVEQVETQEHARKFSMRAAVSAGVADNTTNLQNTINLINALGGGTVYIPDGTFTIAGQVTVPDNVHIEGLGYEKTILNATGSSTPIVGSAKWNGVRFRNFQVTHENNSAGSGIDLIDAAEGANACTFENLWLQGKSGITTNGLRIRGAKVSDSSAADSHNNLLINIQTNTNSDIAGVAVLFDGANVSGKRLNSNMLLGGRLDGFNTGLKWWGNGNAAVNVTFNGPTTTAALHIKGDGSTANNAVIGCYFDSGITGDKIRLEYDDATLIRSMVQVFGCQGVQVGSDITISANGNQTRVRYTLVGQNIIFGGIVDDDTDHENMAQVSSLTNTGVASFMAGLDYIGGRILAAGSARTTVSNSVSPKGGLSGVIQDDADAEFRIVKTADGSTFTVLVDVDSAGVLTMGTGPIIPRRTTNTTATGSLAIDASRGNYFEYTLTGNVTFTGATSPTNGQKITVVIEQSAGGGNTVAFSNTDANGFKLAGGAYTMTSTANQIDVLQFVYATVVGRWVEVSRAQNI